MKRHENRTSIVTFRNDSEKSKLRSSRYEKINYGNACYHSAQNRLSFLPLFKRLQIKTQKTIPLGDAFA